jgi:glycosyltransferase involved in cell wall biosynthesis
MKISIVVPAHNEEGNLDNLVSKLVPVLESHKETEDYELVLVDDN